MNEDVSDEELQAKMDEAFAVARNRVFEKLRMMERVNQITDPNIRLPLKFLLENMK